MAVYVQADASASTCVKVVGETVYLLSIYDKSEQDTLNNNELDTLLSEAGLHIRTDTPLPHLGSGFACATRGCGG